MSARVLAVGMVLVLVAGCGKKAAKNTEPAGPPAVAVAPVDERNTNFRPGGGAVQNVRQAARRTNALVEMKTLGDLVTLTYTESGRMPSREQIVADLKRDAPAVAKGIDEGVYILTGTTDHGGLWAYEVDAERAGGIVLVAGVPNRASAEEVRQHLAKLPSSTPKTPAEGGGRVGLAVPPVEAPAPRAVVAKPPVAEVVPTTGEADVRVAGAESSMPRSSGAPGASKTLPRPPEVELAPAPRPKVIEPASDRVVAQPPQVEPKPAPAVAVEAAPEQPALAVGRQDLEDVRLFIDTVSASGRMPTPELTRLALLAAESPAWKLVERKALVLTGAKTREGVWAYEASARDRGGLVAGPNGVETVTAEELSRRLGVGRR